MHPAEYLLVVSIGNSRVAAAIWCEGKLQHATAIPTTETSEITRTLIELWSKIPSDTRRVALVGSVAPPVLEDVREALVSNTIEPVLLLGQDVDYPIGADLPEPDKVGSDRLCVAAAAYDKMKSACVVADFGTALTIDLVADNGVFLGGTILPGVRLSAVALHEHTALLPLVEVGEPTEILGKDTVSAMRNGIFAMMVGALREVTEGYATQIGKWPPLVITGGDAEAIAKRCDFVDRVMPDLALEGLVLAYHRAIAQDRQRENE
jgi:type III pantothenate kinase